MQTDIKQRTQQWFEQRKGKITASAVGAILGICPNTNKAQLIRRLVREYHGAESEFKSCPPIEYGIYNEKNALASFKKSFNIDVAETGFHLNNTYTWIGASPDGLIGSDALLEIKCPFSKRASADFVSIDNLPHYYAQMQIQMFCTNRTNCFFYQWSPLGHKLELIAYDQDWINESLPKIKEFYEEFLVELDNPVHLEDLEVKIEGKDDLVHEYNQAIAKEKQAKAEVERLKKELLEIADGKKTRIGTRLIFPAIRQGSIDYKKIVSEHVHDIDLEQYRGSPTHYMTIK